MAELGFWGVDYFVHNLSVIWYQLSVIWYKIGYLLLVISYCLFDSRLYRYGVR